MSLRGGPLANRPSSSTYDGDLWYDTDNKVLTRWNRRAHAWEDTLDSDADLDVDAIETAIGTPANASIAADIAEVEGETDALVAAVGTLVNSGGTASLGGILGDPANVSLASRLNTMKTQAGTVFVVTKSLTQSAIVSGGADLTVVSTGGPIEILGVKIQNGATAADSAGHAAVLNILANNVRGSAAFATWAQAKLGANKVADQSFATSLLGLPVLETGKKITVTATTEDFTSAGTMDFYLICRRLADGAALVAA